MTTNLGMENIVVFTLDSSSFSSHFYCATDFIVNKLFCASVLSLFYTGHVVNTAMTHHMYLLISQTVYELDK